MTRLEKEALIREAFAAGKTNRQIAAIVGVSDSRMSRILGGLGLKRDEARDDAINETVRQMRQAGIAFERIGEHLGLSRNAVQSRAITMGIHTVERTREAKEWITAPPNRDAQHVAACLAHGGFIYREVRAGRVVEVRP